MRTPKRAAQDKVDELKARAKDAAVGRAKRAVSAPVTGIVMADCEHCHGRLPKIKMKKYGLGNNKWTCRNHKKCQNRIGWAHKYKRWARHVDYPAGLMDD